MRIDEQHLRSLPSVSRFVSALALSLCDQRCVVALLPQGVEAESVSALLVERLALREVHTVSLWLPDLSPQEPLVRALGTALHLEWDATATTLTPEALWDALCTQGPDVVCLQGYRSVPQERQAELGRLISYWAQRLQGRVSQGGPRLCLFGSALRPTLVPKPDVCLAVHWWWGFPSAQEVQWVARCRVEPLPPQLTASWYREHLVPSLSGNDLDLADALWEQPYLDAQDLWDCLRGYAEARHWDPDLLSKWGATTLAESVDGISLASDAPPEWSRWMWEHGVLQWTPEYGLELHSAALAVLAHAEWLNHRIWRSQAAVALPLVERVRVRVCQDITRQHGDRWPYQCLEPKDDREKQEVRENPMACQFGHLAYLLGNCRSLRSAADRWQTVTTVAQEVRRDLAHGRLASAAQMDRLQEAAQKAGILPRVLRPA